MLMIKNYSDRYIKTIGFVYFISLNYDLCVMFLQPKHILYQITSRTCLYIIYILFLNRNYLTRMFHKVINSEMQLWHSELVSGQCEPFLYGIYPVTTVWLLAPLYYSTDS